MNGSHLLGQCLEIEFSQRFHQAGTALLISPTFLRRNHAGQIDMARLVNGRIEIVEIKSSALISPKQRQRLKNSAGILAKIFSCPVSLQLVCLKDGRKDCQKAQEYLSFYL